MIYAADHRGHGKSEGLRAYVERFDLFVEDQKIFLDLINEKEPNLPIFLLGSSMGSMIAQIFTATYPEGINGLVLAAAGTKLGGVSGFMKPLVKFLALIVPKSRVSDPTIDQLSRDHEVVKAYKEDPLVSSKK